MVDTARNGPTVMAVAGGRKQQSSCQPSSRPLLGQRENPLPRREDGAPVFRSSNGSRTRNGCVTPRILQLNFFSFLYSPKFGRYLFFSFSLAKP
jgi:hypothetical protein